MPSEISETNLNYITLNFDRVILSVGNVSIFRGLKNSKRLLFISILLEHFLSLSLQYTKYLIGNFYYFTHYWGSIY